MAEFLVVPPVLIIGGFYFFESDDYVASVQFFGHRSLRRSIYRSVILFGNRQMR